MLYYRTLGIVLKSQNHQEADRTYTVYTEKYGKIKVLVKGARKINSKLAGHLEPFNLIDLTVVKGRAWDKIINVSTVESFSHLKRNFRKIIYGSYILEIVDNLIKEHHQDKEVFKLLKKTLNNLQIAKQSFCQIIDYFVLRLLCFLGYEPNLSFCVFCKKKKVILSKNKFVFISWKFGGLLCSQCKKFDQNSSIISEENVRKIKEMLTENLIPENHDQSLTKITNSFLKYHLEKELESEKFIFGF